MINMFRPDRLVGAGGHDRSVRFWRITIVFPGRDTSEMVDDWCASAAFGVRREGVQRMIGSLLLSAAIASSPDLGIAAGRCRTSENGPAFLVDVEGLKDRAGRLKLELYPAKDGDFLADDNVLIAASKPFARVDVPTPPSGGVQLCIRAPGPGRYALMLLHDRKGDHRFELSSDGVGFSGNPHLGWSKPDVEHVAATIGNAPKQIAIILNYRHGLSMRPERPAD